MRDRTDEPRGERGMKKMFDNVWVSSLYVSSFETVQRRAALVAFLHKVMHCYRPFSEELLSRLIMLPHKCSHALHVRVADFVYHNPLCCAEIY